MHSCKSRLPADYQFADPETCRKRFSLSRIEHSSVYEFAGIVHEYYAVQCRIFVSGTYFKLTHYDSTFQHLHAFLLRLGLEELLVCNLILDCPVRFLAHMFLLIYVNAKLERFDDMSIISSNIVANHNYYALMYKPWSNIPGRRNERNTTVT